MKRPQNIVAVVLHLMVTLFDLLCYHQAFGLRTHPTP